MSTLGKRKTYSEKCPICGGEDHPLADETICFDELAPNAPIHCRGQSGSLGKSC